ncbi:hypothetical protein GOP47_0000987 [Adiantum capillus-veneris]|uniref:Uncharacterized protein n=1 Tax=Adiantum capillus-veneris TaxID=13818 RepID=A0A9D4ZR86_ADICA|nr:hypothetical protein GOP47_0000987 [Adiantum capillus-veneris]
MARLRASSSSPSGTLNSLPRNSCTNAGSSSDDNKSICSDASTSGCCRSASYSSSWKSDEATLRGGSYGVDEAVEAQSYKGEACCESPARASKEEEEARECPPAPRKKKAVAKRSASSNKRRTLLSPPLPDIDLFFSSIASAHAYTPS